MAANKLQLGILGCGDFLRWQNDSLKNSQQVEIKSLFDPEIARAEKYAAQLGGKAVKTEDEIFGDKEIDIVCLFVPPWIRKGMVLKAAQAGKQIIATKPLGPNAADCAAMVKAVEGKVKCGILYSRTDNLAIHTYKKIFDSGEIGKLALYKQDWIHHYPEWNQWALDPEKNGGPFMDAMIHNLNNARYLMGRLPTTCAFFSNKLAHPQLKCADTESMVLEFGSGAVANLFITWAADLAVYSKEGNDREHIDLFYLVTDQGWRLTHSWEKAGLTVKASKDGKEKTWVGQPPAQTIFDQFAESVGKNSALPPDLPGVKEAYEDIKLLRDAEKRVGSRFAVDLSLP